MSPLYPLINLKLDAHSKSKLKIDMRQLVTVLAQFKFAYRCVGFQLDDEVVTEAQPLEL